LNDLSSKSKFQFLKCQVTLESASIHARNVFNLENIQCAWSFTYVPTEEIRTHLAKRQGADVDKVRETAY